MAIRLQTNPAGQIARQNFSGNVFFLSESIRKLSSGLRVNKTADDSIAVSLARQFESQALGLGQAAKNANDGISAMQVVDNSLAEAMDVLGSIQNKAVAATQDDQTATGRLSLQSDINKLLKELDQLVDSATYHDLPLLTGTYTNKTFQVGTVSGETLSASLPSSRQYQVGQLRTGEMTITSSLGGQVNFQLVNQDNNETINVRSVTLAYDNDPDHGMGALALAINAYAESTGISARAVVESVSGSALVAGTTPDAFAVNGVKIGALNVLDGDSDGHLLTVINAKTSSHGVVAAISDDGALVLTASDGRSIEVSGSGGVLGFTDAEMTTFGFTRILQNGPYDLSLSDLAAGLAVAFSPTMQLGAAVTTTIDSTLTRDSILGSSSTLTAGWTAGLDVTGADLNGNISTTEDSTLMVGSVLASGSELAASTIIGGAVTLDGSVATLASTVLRAGSILASGSVIEQGSYLTNAVNTTSGALAAGQVLAVDVTLSGPLTLAKDMLLFGGSVLAAGSSLATSSQIGGEVVLNGSLTVSQEMTLAAGSMIQDSGGVTLLAAGSTIGGVAQLAGTDLTVTEAMLVKAGSTLTGSSELAFGSTIGGAVVLAGDHTSSHDLFLEAGSIIAAGSIIKSGTTLTNDLVTTSGLLSDGTTTTQDYQTLGANSLGVAMTLKNGSRLATGSTLAANSKNETAVELSQESSSRLGDITVTTKDEATIAVKIIEAAMADMDKIRQQAAAISDQLAGVASVQGGAKDIMDGAKAKLLDVDFGEEAVNFTRMEMLIRSSSFALTQANAAPGNVFMVMQGGGERQANQFFIAALNRMITTGAVN